MELSDWSCRSWCKIWLCVGVNSVIDLAKSERGPGWSFLSCSVIDSLLAGCCVVGLAETVYLMVCCTWRRTVDIHDSLLL